MLVVGKGAKDQLQYPHISARQYICFEGVSPLLTGRGMWYPVVSAFREGGGGEPQSDLYPTGYPPPSR